MNPVCLVYSWLIEVHAVSIRKKGKYCISILILMFLPSFASRKHILFTHQGRVVRKLRLTLSFNWLHVDGITALFSQRRHT